MICKVHFASIAKWKMTFKIVDGKCYHVSLYRTKENVELLSIIVRAKDEKIWKFNLGDWTKILNNREDVFKLMDANTLKIRTKCDSQGKKYGCMLLLLYCLADETYNTGQVMQAIRVERKDVNEQAAKIKFET